MQARNYAAPDGTSKRPMTPKHNTSLTLMVWLLAIFFLAATSVPLRAQSATFSGAQTTLIGGLYDPFGVATDANGDVFIADSENDRIVEVPWTGTGYGAPTTVPTSGLSFPQAVAVDAAGDIFIADTNNNRVVEVPWTGSGYGTQTTLPTSGLHDPESVAVDGAGDVFIADTANRRVVELSGSGYSTQTTLSVSEIDDPLGVAVDGAGDLFIADFVYNQVVELPWTGTTWGPQITVTSGLNGAYGVAVDKVGNVFVTNYDNNTVAEAPWTGSGYGSQVVLSAPGLNQPSGVAVDTKGDVFVADTFNNRVQELQTQSVNFGSANVCPTPQTTPAPCSNTLTLSYNITASGTLGNPNVLTQGVPNLDFILASGSTCTGAVTASSTCTVNVIFAPTAAGTRAGAVQITDGSGNVLATTAIYGLGQAPAIAYSPSVQIAVASTGISLPTGIATDQSGNVYIVDRNNGRLLKVTPSLVQSTVASGLTTPWGVAVDGEGNIFISSTFNDNVLALYASGSQATLPTSGLSQPEGLAVDGAGDLFIADNFNSRVVEITPAGVQTTVPATGLGHPVGVGVDAAGNVYIADSTHGHVVEVTPAGVQTTVPATGLTAPFDVKVDSAGNVYIADINIQGVVQVSPTGVQTTFPLSGSSGVWKPESLALDIAGDVVVGDSNGNGVAKLLRSQPPALSFATTSVGQTSSDSPKSVTIQNIGNQPLNAVAPGLSIGSNFAQVPGSGTPEDCTSGFSLVPGATCNLSISFEPQATGLLAGSAVLTDNALNGNPATQTILLSGTGTQGSQTITFTGLPATATYGSAGPYTLNATASSGLPVTYAVTGPAILSGSTLTITGAGTVTVTASQAGNTNYAPATPVSQTIVVSQASQTITFGPISSQPQGVSLTLSATSSSGLPVSFSSTTTAVCTVSGTTATLVNPGTCTIQASQAGNANYAAATPVSQSFTVLAGFTITPIPGSETIKRGVLAGFILQLNASKGFSGNVKLSCSGGPAGAECADLPMTVKLNSGGIAFAVSGILFPANTTPGTYTMTFTGTSGSITETATAKFTVTK